MFEQLIADAASRFNLSSAGVASLVRELLALIVNGRGGAEGFIEQFGRAGLGDAITSWFGGKEGRTISPAQMESALGASTLERLSTHTGLAQSLVSSASAFLLPRIMGLLTPNGTLSSTSDLLSQISHFMGSPAMASAAVRRQTTPPPRRRWAPWAVAAVAVLAVMMWLGGRGGGTGNTELTLSNRGGEIPVDAARAANDKAISALRAIGTSGVSTTDIVRAMNLGVINFAPGSAEITPDSQDVIKSSAAALKRASTGTKVEIGGHTDNTGPAETNLVLSQARADAVKRALVAEGVHAEMLTTNGYGDTRPRTSNDTERGRFENRRIEYTVVR